VNIPAGIETGMRLRLSNEGEHGINGGPPGDLFVAVTVKPHAVFTRKNTDLLCEIQVPFVTAALGGKVEVPTLQGNTIIKIPAGTQGDKSLRLKGLGVPSLKGQQTGDQVIKVKIQIPTKLSVKQKELLTEFAKESGISLDTEGDGFFDKMKTFFE
jgi:molecular chaperone DnaJ